MELKYNFDTWAKNWKAGFNRTFMELKSARKTDAVVVAHRFNRTFMELKCYSLLSSDTYI